MRRCLLAPIPEFELAAELLDAAADALLQDNSELARKLIAKADYPAIMEHSIKIVGRLSTDVHRQVHRPETLPKPERYPDRMPTMAVQNEIFARDGWRCRFCRIKVISRKSRGVLIRLFPDETHWVSSEFKRHTALYTMAVSLDHVVPHSRGGNNEEANFVTACYCCQVGRGEWLLEEMELLDPRTIEPIIDDWDGLSRIEKIQMGAS